MTAKLRQRQLDRLDSDEFDVLIVGGGINGAVSASALSAAGARVALVESGDFAGFTSQASSNLAWGGIKYLESFEFGLVWELCRSRNELMRSYPSSVREIRFLTTIGAGFRHHPLILLAGAWLYWCFGRGFTQLPRLLSAKSIEREEPNVAVPANGTGIEYSDAYLHDNDARFVFGFIKKSLARGAASVNYVRACAARRQEGYWYTEVVDEIGGERKTIRSKVVVNATGPFVDEYNQMAGVETVHRHVFSKGVHLLVERISAHEKVLAFFASDGRLFFAIPMFDKTCIGTTDTRVESPFAEVTDYDRQFILDNINACLRLERPLTREDIVSERCGVRPLVVDRAGGQARDFLQLSRKHVIDASVALGQVSIFGGKLTDCLNIGSEVCRAVGELGVSLGDPGRWYGEPDASTRAAFVTRAREIELEQYRHPSAHEPLTDRLWRRYNDDAFAMLDAIERDAANAATVIEGSEYLRCEITHIANAEMVVRLEDFMRRRSKIALVNGHDRLRALPGVRRACDFLFGAESSQRFDEYFELANGRSDAGP